MIRKLRLRYFRQHTDTVLEFVPGVNTIVGANNSGKSTIPEAIEYAFYGARALRDSAKSYIQDGKSEGSSVVELSINNDQYKIGRNSKNAELRKNGELDAQYKDNVSQYVARITGVNHMGFRLGHYVRQKELSAFSQLRPGKRHEAVERMLKINAIDKAIAELKGEVDLHEAQQRGYMSSYQDVELLQEEQQTLENALVVSKESETQLRDRLTLLSDQLKRQREKQLKLARKPELAQYREELAAITVAEQELARVKKALDTLDIVDEAAFQALKSAVANMRTLERQSITMAAKKKELDELETLVRPEFMEEPIAPLSTELDNKKLQVRTLSKVIDEASCPTCLQPIDKRHIIAVLEYLETAIASLQSYYDVDSFDYEAKRSIYQKYTVKYTAYEASLLRRNKLVEEYIEVAFDATDQLRLEAELDAAREAASAKEALIAERRVLTVNVEKKDQVLDKIRALIHLDELEDDPNLASAIEINSSDSKTINTELQNKASEKARIESRILILDRLISSMQETKRSIAVNASKLAGLKAQKDSFILFKRYLTAKIRPMLQDLAEALFHKTTKNRYAAYNLASDYEVTLTTHNGYMRKLNTISGSENDLACLCLRLAIATLRNTKLAGSVGFIILDEISGSFDDDRTKQTLEGLLELKDVVPQIINITHKTVEMRYADRIFTVKEINGVANVSWE